MAQKRHSSYNRDSYGLLVKSLRLLFQNYLSINDHYRQVEIFIFHTGDFDATDLVTLEDGLSDDKYKGMIRLVNLNNTEFWALPDWVAHDDQSTWLMPSFSVGYRHMIRWFSIHIWRYFSLLRQNEERNRDEGPSSCQPYRYILRLDEDSFIHSPIQYSLFDDMRDNRRVYGFRQCAYEMGDVMTLLSNNETELRTIDPHFKPYRAITPGLCGFYNNFFVADINFFLSKPVQHFLNWVDRDGAIYRNRTGDLLLHTAAVFAFANQSQIHRFLDFSYEHVTLATARRCPINGGLQAGYNDENALETVASFINQHNITAKCIRRKSFRIRVENVSMRDLSPSLSHLPARLRNTSLLQIKAGNVDLIGEDVSSE
jgi:alpha 1,2-mannosyltransferase